MLTDPSTPPGRPWWVHAAIPSHTLTRRAVVRGTLGTLALVGLCGALFTARTFEQHPQRWWSLAFFAVVVVGLGGWQYLAIRWTDRAGLWRD